MIFSTRFVGCLLWALVFLATSGAQIDPRVMPADGTPIAAVRVEGADKVRPRDVEAILSLRTGGEFTRSAYRRDLQALANLGTLDPIATRITWEAGPEDAMVVVVQIQENPTIRRIDIVGNVRYSRRQLLSELTYKVGDLQPTGVRAQTIRNLSSFYRNGGFKDVRVTAEVEDVEGDEPGVAIRIFIDERERIKIRRIVLNGNTHFNTFLATSRLTNSPRILFFPSYYDESAIEDDLAVLREQYENAGFLDVRVTRGEFVYDEARREITLVFNVEEGPRYRISEIASEGVTYFLPSEVEKFGSRLEGRTFNGRRLARVLGQVRRLYGDQGYIETVVGYRLDRNVEARTARVILTVRESGVSYVGAVTLDMEDYDFRVDVPPLERAIRVIAPPTRPEALMREVRLKTGEKFRTADQVRTEERLRNLGFLRKVEVTPVPTADPEVKDAMITVEEDPAAAYVGIAAGVGEVSGPSLTLSLVQPNMGGVANRLEVAYTIGTRSQAWRATYFDRYLGESDNSLETSLYFLSERYLAYRQRTLGATTELGRPLSEYLTGYMRLRAEQVRFSDTSDTAIEEDFDRYYVLAVRPMLVYDRRDNRFWATQGYMVSGGFEAGTADGFLLQALHSLEWYHQFERSDWIYAYRHSVGLSPFKASEVGIADRFYLGGSSSLRGFRARGVGPTDRGDDELHLGGATRLAQTHEFRYPFTEYLRGRLFTDIGILERGPFELGPPRVGAGAGIVVDLGAVQLEVDLATAVIKERTDRRQFLHLRLGSRF